MPHMLEKNGYIQKLSVMTITLRKYMKQVPSFMGQRGENPEFMGCYHLFCL